jgi:hypothetical protein
MSIPSDTDPGAAPMSEMTGRSEEGESLERASATSVDTDPGPVPAHEAPEQTREEPVTEETQIETREIIARFMASNHEPRRGPSTPPHQAFSDGHPFVAYQTVHSPAVSARPHITAPGVHVDGAIADEVRDATAPPRARESDPSPPLVAQRDVPTLILPRGFAFQRRAAMMVTLGIGLVGLVLFVRIATSQRAPSVPPSAAVAPTVLAPTVERIGDSIPPPVEEVVTPMPSSSTTETSPRSATPRPRKPPSRGTHVTPPPAPAARTEPDAPRNFSNLSEDPE